MEEEMSEENVVCAKYFPGDLLWTKCGRFPYWPCMITFNPDNGKFTKQAKGKSVIYHVQYFGPDVLRGWTSPESSNSFLFKGEKEFVVKVQELKTQINDLGSEAPQTLIQSLDKYKVPKIHRRKWDIAVKEAEKALLCTDIRERFESHVFDFGEIKKTSHLHDTAVENNDSYSSSEPSTSKDQVPDRRFCDTCGKSDVNFPCSTCEKFFHLGCVGLIDIPDNFSCFDCVSMLIQPSNFGGFSSSPTTMELSWRRPSMARDKIIGYEVHYKKTTSKFHFSRRVEDVETYTLEELYPHTMYILWLACRSEKGEMAATPPIKVRTQKEVKVFDESINDPSSGSTLYLHTKIEDTISLKVFDESISIGCVVCHSSTGTIIQCSVQLCKNVYHRNCVSKYEYVDLKDGACPQHTCVTCYRIKPGNLKATKGKMTKCTQCPMAFHCGTCYPAGSTLVNGNQLICPFHYVGSARESTQPVCNMNSCAKCNTGGELVCCEACPISFHKDCLNKCITDKDFICEDCENKIYLVHDMIVWTKVGHYRWWPGKIIHPSNVPHVMKNTSSRGEFPVEFFGTHNFTWTHSGRTFPFTEDHKTVVSGSNTTLGNNYSKALQEAADAFDKYTEFQQRSVEDKSPKSYGQVKKSQKKVQSDDDYICDCDPKAKNPCGPESDCYNRKIFVECNPAYCHAKTLCQNQNFQKREYAATSVVKTKNRGWGLKAVNSLKQGQFVIEYVGEIITRDEYLRRSAKLQKKGIEDYYFLYLDSKRIIDAGPKGNKSRFINHSCEPNCESTKWRVQGDNRIGIFAIRDIAAGEELTFDYQLEQCEYDQHCLCGAAKCRGFIGKKSVSQQKVPITKTSKRKTLDSPESDVSDSTSKSKLPKVDLPRISEASNVADHQKSKQKVPITKASETKLKSLPSRKSDVSDSTSKSMVSEADISSNSKSSKVADHLKSKNKNKVSSIQEASNSENSSKLQLVVLHGKLPEIKVVPYESDNICFICKKPGTLLLCDKIGCARVYHLKCLELSEKPQDQWLCRLHNCNLCQKPPAVHCRLCTLSLCKKCVKVMPKGSFICEVCKSKS